MKTKIYAYLASLSVMVSMLLSGVSHAQCTNAFEYPFGGAAAPTAIAPSTTISTCSFQSEYSALNFVEAATIYQCSIGTGGYITIRQGTPTGPVIASGISPLQWNSTVAGTYYAHWNVDAACGTASNCVTTTATYISPASACTNPVAAGAGNKRYRINLSMAKCCNSNGSLDRHYWCNCIKLHFTTISRYLLPMCGNM